MLLPQARVSYKIGAMIILTFGLEYLVESKGIVEIIYLDLQDISRLTATVMEGGARCI